MAQRVIDTVLKQVPEKKKQHLVKSHTERIPLTSCPMTDTKEVNAYEKEIATQLKIFGIEDANQSEYLATTYGKQADDIIQKIDYFLNEE